MQRITSTKELKQAIQQLESDQKRHGHWLVNQYNLIVASLNPLNLLSITAKKILLSPVVLLFGMEKIKSIGHHLIDRLFPAKETADDQK